MAGKKEQINELICQMIDKGHALTVYRNALGTITGRLHSVSELVTEEDNDVADNWKGKPNQRSQLLEGETITDGRNLSEVINRLHQKSEFF